ncbi:MAG: hypothetical protein PVF65_00250 [Sphingomonadales bacterium]|jgi:hypothetical protein
MGAWGYKLYQCDDAQDFREEFKFVKNFPFGEDQFLAYFKDSCGYLRGDDQSIQWLVLYDQFHQYAIDAPLTLQRVKKIIKNGEDITYHRDLDMSERDLEKRAKHLEDLWQTWQSPPVKPKKRKLVNPDQPFVMDVGDVYIYPTENGWPRMPRSEWSAMGVLDPGKKGQPVPEVNLTEWAAFVVLKRQRTAGIIPQYVVLRLKLETGVERPNLEDVKNAFIAGGTDNKHFYNAKNHMYVELQTYYVETTAQALKHLRAECLGNLSIDTAILLHDMEKFSVEQHWRWRHLQYLRYEKEGWDWSGGLPSPEPYFDGVYKPAEMKLAYRKSLSDFLWAGDVSTESDWQRNMISVKALPLKNYFSEAKPAKRTERFFTIDDLRRP